MIEAATELLREGGSTALTIEAVAAHSGVAKTTIYRHFADRDVLHLAALDACGSAAAVQNSGDIYADIESWMQRFAVALYSADFASLLPTVIDAAERSPNMALSAMEMTKQRRSVIVSRLRSAIADGELAPGSNAEFLGEQLASPLFYRRFISRQRLPKQYVSDVVRSVLTPVMTTPR